MIRRRPPVATSDDGSTTSAVRASSSSSIPASELNNQAKKTNRIVLDTITELSNELLSKGLTGIYSMTYEALQNSTWLWEYKGLLDGVVYGPFTASQLSNWKTQGYFAGTTAVLVRPVGENAMMDGDNENTAHHSSSNVRTSNHSKSVVSSGSSIYDDDMLDTTASGGNNVIGNDSSYAASCKGYEWTSSDEVDFGEYVNLDNDDMVSSRGKGKGRLAGKQSKVRTAADRSGYVENSRSRSRLDQQDDDDDNEEDEEDDNANDDGMSFRHKRKKVQHEEDDDDD